MQDKFLAYLAEKRAKAVHRRQKADDEIAEIDRAEWLYRESGAVQPNSPTTRPQVLASILHGEESSQTDVGDLLGPFAPSRVEKYTIKERVKRILDGYPSGLTSGQILTILKTNGLPDLARESLSPQLTRLKKEGEINLDTSTSLWTRVQKHEAPGA